MVQGRCAVVLSVIAAGCVLAPSAAQAGWPGANGKLAFDSARTGNADIHAVAPSVGTAGPLTSHEAADVRPAWSPDGRRVAFESFRDGNYEIYVMNADGSGQVALSTTPRTTRTRCGCRTASGSPSRAPAVPPGPM